MAKSQAQRSPHIFLACILNSIISSELEFVFLTCYWNHPVIRIRALQALILITNSAFLPWHLASTPSMPCMWPLVPHHPSSNQADDTLTLSNSDPYTLSCYEPCDRDVPSPGNGKSDNNERKKVWVATSPGLPFLYPESLRILVYKVLEMWWLLHDCYLRLLCKSEVYNFTKAYKCHRILPPSLKYFIILSLVHSPITAAIRGLISTTAPWNKNLEIIVLEKKSPVVHSLLEQLEICCFCYFENKWFLASHLIQSFISENLLL